jgi:uncharacterized protein
LLDSVFVLPIMRSYLVYAPLDDLAALVDRAAVKYIWEGLTSSGGKGSGRLGEIVASLKAASRPPLPRRGPLKPAFLGLIPTRDCNLACRYCGFLPEGESRQVMDLKLARDAVDWYLGLVARGADERQDEDGCAAEVHFFGGEPFCATEVVDFVYHRARLKAAELGCSVRFETATNGVQDERRCRWIADSLDDVVLSLDGSADIQDRQRPHRGGQGSFAVVARSARILSEGRAELSLRACVAAETVDRMPETAAWFCQEFRPVSVCFEPVQPTAQSEAAGLAPPDPWVFARRFIEAAEILEEFGVKAVYAAADIGARRVSFCPIGRDVPIVSPDGTISACYLLRQEWEQRGMDLVMGQFQGRSVQLNEGSVAAVRELNVWNKPFCQRCFCKWHCAGGCHVNNILPAVPGDYGRLCIQTRVIALYNVLRAMDQTGLAAACLQDGTALAAAVQQPSDRIADVVVGL